jgi:hypothetical protein
MYKRWVKQLWWRRYYIEFSIASLSIKDYGSLLSAWEKEVNKDYVNGDCIIEQIWSMGEGLA